MKTQFCDLVTTETGEKLCKTIIDKLLLRFRGKQAHQELSNKLNQNCPSLHNSLSMLFSQVHPWNERGKNNFS